MRCPICDSHSVFPFLSRPAVPVHQHLVYQTPELARQILSGNLDLYACPQCEFVYNAAFDPQLLNYGPQYENAQGHSPAFQSYEDQLITQLLTQADLANGTLVEVGCGNGAFLKKIMQQTHHTRAYGFDPSYQGVSNLYNDRLHFVSDYLKPDTVLPQITTVLCRHVIEHVPDPVEFLKSIHKAIAHNPQVKLYFETPNLDWILENHVVWDFFYEHCNYFTPCALQHVFQQAGFRVSQIDLVFDKQYLWIEASPNPETLTYQPPSTHTVPFTMRMEQYQKAEAHLMTHWQETLPQLCQQGPLALWGAGAKGVTFANLFDPHQRWLTCVVDLNPKKQGGFLPGSGHPIVNWTDLPDYGAKHVVLMNPNYQTECSALLKQANMDINLITETPLGVTQ